MKLSYLITNSLLLTVSLFIAASVQSPTRAASLTFNIEEFTGTNAEVKITLDDTIAGLNKIRLTAEVLSTNTGTIGDIIGIFFNLSDNSLINNLSLSPVSQSPGSPLTVSTSSGFNKLFLDRSGSSSDGTTDVENNVNLNGGGDQRNFEVAVQVGKGGLKGGNDDYRSVTFDLQATNLNLSQFYGQKFGVRLQSVGTETSRTGSSKLEGDIPQPTVVPTDPAQIVPEPNTLTGLFLSCFGLLGLRRKH